MDRFSLRPVIPEQDFHEIAALFSLEQAEPTSEPALKAGLRGTQGAYFLP